MKRLVRKSSPCAVALAALSLGGGCAEQPAGGQPNPALGGPAPSAGGGAGPTAGIKQIMSRLTKGPNSLTPVLGRELKEAEPPWETIQGQTKEYAHLAADMARFDPPKGAKESWVKLTAAYAESAAQLDQAAQAKDKSAALAAHEQLAKSCMSCHQEHRKGGPGMGGPGMGGPGMGGPPGFGPRGGMPPGGPPPGGPPGDEGPK